MKWQPEKTHATLESYARMAAASPAQLIVLPETALPLFESDLPDFYREGLASLGRNDDLWIRRPVLYEISPVRSTFWFAQSMQLTPRHSRESGNPERTSLKQIIV